MTISVIIPVYNRRELLASALDSVYAQTLPPKEIIVIDDGSTDGVGEMLAKKLPQVQCIVQPNRGVSAARNAGIAAAKGEWIAFLDSDDEWLPKKLEMQIAALEKAFQKDQFQYKICHTNEIWIRNGRRVNQMKKHQKHGGYIFQKCLPLCVISPSSVMIHHSIFEHIGVFDESLPACEDYDLWLRICARYPVLYLDEPLIKKYGGHADQLSQKYWGMDRFRIQALEKVLKTAEFDDSDRKAALGMLLTKIEVYLQGAEKRHKTAEITSYLHKKEHYQKKLTTIL